MSDTHLRYMVLLEEVLRFIEEDYTRFYNGCEDCSKCDFNKSLFKNKRYTVCDAFHDIRLQYKLVNETRELEFEKFNQAILIGKFLEIQEKIVETGCSDISCGECVFGFGGMVACRVDSTNRRMMLCKILYYIAELYKYEAGTAKRVCTN